MSNVEHRMSNDEVTATATTENGTGHYDDDDLRAREAAERGVWTSVWPMD
jgi:Zn/Cd-binding protein ZinT